MAPSPPQDDFSFPTITNTPPRFLESPPLWRTTSVASRRLQKNPKNDHNIKGEGEENLERKSFSYIENEEDKMDMLWENLNEEMTCGKDTKKVEVKSFNLSKASKRPSLVVLIKVLKKVFL